MKANTKLDFNQQYVWSMIVHADTVGQEHWGTYKARYAGETVAEAMEAIRQSCASKMGAPLHVVTVFKFTFAKQG
ncbi:hypothetical protein [Streptomyces sparsogenes]|uniref:hypothetical protein n=1 Tax=Streptomyces sparsogenes TaxID=67365 RepID=UPI0033C1C3EE